MGTSIHLDAFLILEGALNFRGAKAGDFSDTKNVIVYDLCIIYLCISNAMNNETNSLVFHQ